jgi:hypothetical protein
MSDTYDTIFDTSFTNSSSLEPTQDILNSEDKMEIIYFLKDLDKFKDISDSTLFSLVGSGNTGKIYTFEYNSKKYGIKIYNKKLSYEIPKIKDSDNYVKTEFYNKNNKTYAIFDYFEDYVSLKKWIENNKNTTINHCYNLDQKNRWIIIFNLIHKMYSMHQENVYHRDIHPDNIIINPKNYNIKFIDLDTICLDSIDCKKDLHERYLQAKLYQIHNFSYENFEKYGYIYAQDLDYYSIGIVILEILNITGNIQEMINEINKITLESELNTLICENFYFYFYPSCKIHKQIFKEFYEIFLFHCLNKKFYKNLFVNIHFIRNFILNNFVKEKKINIKSTIRAFSFNGNNNLMYHILTHAFYNYNIIINETEENYYNENTDDFVVHGAFEIENTNFYKCPYICLSIEPFRPNIYQKLIEINNLPILELNTFKNISCYLTGQYNSSLISKQYVSFLNRENNVYDKFSCYTDNYWLPFFLLFYIGQIDFNQENNTKISRFDHQFDKRKVNFMYIARNCSNKIRETIFTKLRNNTHEKAVSLGKCQNTDDENEFLKMQMGGNNWKDILKNKLNIKEDNDEQYGGNYWEKNFLLYSKTKFAIALENSLQPGYITEKIILAFSGGAIPIYWGPPEIKEFFNEKSFYYLNEKFEDPNNPTDEELNNAICELIKLANDESEESGWKKYLLQPVFKDNIVHNFFNYRNNTYIEEIINKIKLSYPIQREQLNKILYKSKTSDTKLLQKYIKYKNKYINTKIKK